MSNIPRYRPVANDKYGITDDVDGKLCEYRDYARLKAERVHDLNQIGGLQQELAELRASSFVTAVPVEQYERVVKAGDAMVLKLPDMMAGVVKAEEAIGLMNDWIAAKEGKPSA